VLPDSPAPPGPDAPPRPPYVPIRARAWPQRRLPRSAYVIAAALLVIAVAVALVHKPTRGEQASDMRGFLQEVTSDIESCAGGVSESLTALRDIQSGASRSAADVNDAVIIAQTGAANCSPANNEQIDDLENYQVPESLDSFHLAGVVTGLVNWADPDAANVQNDVASLLSARTPLATSRAQAALNKALAVLSRQGSAAESTMRAAIRTLVMTASPPRLPG
jgi:hypothetical protein